MDDYSFDSNDGLWDSQQEEIDYYTEEEYPENDS